MTQRLIRISPYNLHSVAQLTEQLQTETPRPAGRHRAYMSLVLNRGRWHCRFHRDDLAKTPISRQFVFSSAEKIYEIARRGDGLISVESRQALDVAVTIGRGGIWLRLTEDQYAALVLPKPSPSN